MQIFIMTEPKTPVRRLRSTTVHYMHLRKEESLALGGLPTNRNVLKVILLKKTKALSCFQLTKSRAVLLTRHLLQSALMLEDVKTRVQERDSDLQRRREKEAERGKMSEIRVCPADLDFIVGADNNNNSNTGNNNIVAEQDDEEWKPKPTNKNRRYITELEAKNYASPICGRNTTGSW